MKTKHYKYYGCACNAFGFAYTGCVYDGASDTKVWVDERTVRDLGNMTVAEQSFVFNSSLWTRTFRLFRLPSGDIGARYFDLRPGAAPEKSVCATKAQCVFDNENDARAYFDAMNERYCNSTKGWVKA